MNNNYKICVFTGTRAEYGLLKPLMEEIQKQPEFELQIIASCMHLSPEFGLTYKEIEKDGFNIDEKVEMLLSSDTPVGTIKSMGIGMIGYADALNKLKPDLVFVLGDRFEALAFAISAYILRIPIAHLYGGEITEGALDEAFRHSITKLSHLHFTSTEIYRKRIIQMGESPDRVFNVGALGVDIIQKLKLLTKIEVETKLGISFKQINFLITYHPETFSNYSIENVKEILKAFEELENTMLIFTKSNADAEGIKINEMIKDFVESHQENAILINSMGQLLYLSTMQYVDAVIGNSSSGIIEAPSLKIATINIGDRQKGRIRAKSVMDCEPKKDEILKSIETVLSEEFKRSLINIENPYGNGNSAKKILEKIKYFLPIKGTKKVFFDIVEV
jgi:UDP-hydrolysing UDP-N-acetyl-D-glucosamine 2-epimerase